MKIENLIDSISCVDFLNTIDNLIFKLLYEPNKGFCSLKSKDAIDKSNLYIEEFENEIQEITKNNKNDIQDLIEEKRKEFLFKIKEHYFKQADIWANHVYSNLINNCLLSAYINKNDKYMLDRIYNRGLCGISWLTNIKKYPKEIKDNLLTNFNKEFNKSVNSKDDDFISKNTAQTDYKLFFELYFMILDNEEEFNSKNFDEFSSKLTFKDVSYLNQLKAKLKTSKRSETKDEIYLIKSAMDIINFKDKKEQYNFFIDVVNDFKNYFTTNKKLDEQTKIALLKRRMEIFKMAPMVYFKKVLN